MNALSVEIMIVEWEPITFFPLKNNWNENPLLLKSNFVNVHVIL